MQREDSGLCLKFEVNTFRQCKENYCYLSLQTTCFMKKLFSIVLLLLCSFAYAQENPTEQAQPIVKEGKLLYRSEMASWYGTDLFIEKYKNAGNISGYFSYTEDSLSKCVFFSQGEPAKVIGTITFDSTYNIETANLDLTERSFTAAENDLYLLRKAALSEINSDTMFGSYKNTSLNLIPLIIGNEKKVYLLTGPKEPGVVIFGNDYLLTFDKNNKVLIKKPLHKNIILVYYGKSDGNEEGTIHTHLPETGDFITATDICTLMLYAKFAKWKQHNVVSANYLNIWDCINNRLLVLPMSTIKKINEYKANPNTKDKEND
jgi:hypothetical protein